MPYPEARKHVCHRCSRSYGKAEHLRRHERAHTGSKPYKCPSCNRDFSRQDSLARHSKRHVGDIETSDQIANDTILTHVDTISRNVRDDLRSMTRISNVPLPLSNNDAVNNTHQNAFQASTPNGSRVDNTGSLHDETFLQLNWPDAEGLLQSILAADVPPWQSHENTTYSTLAPAAPFPQTASESPWMQSSTEEDQAHGANDAVHNLSNIITSVSTNVAVEAQSTGLTSVFLDDSLQAFWTQFVPSFQVVHYPTFIFKDWTYPLLLNAIAIGSLFSGQEEGRLKGEILWRLAHTSVATSWHTLIKHRGPYDACCGVQLVLTALLGQVYATFSRNITLRKTAHIFHSLGFFWAQESGMYDIDWEIADIQPRSDDPNERLIHKWRIWAARETQIRALLGHYILDGQISQYNGGRVCQRHAANPLPGPCNSSAFNASTCNQWMRMSPRGKQMSSYRDHIKVIFSPHIHVSRLGSIPLSSLSARVILEVFRSFVTEGQYMSSVVGMPSQNEIGHALSRFHTTLISSKEMTESEKIDVLLRWHTIGLDSAVNSGQLCHNLCHRFSVRQSILRGQRHDNNFDLTAWAESASARRGLLHAIAIHDNLARLPLGQARAMHLPAASFAAALVYLGMLFATNATNTFPREVDWESFPMTDILDSDNINDEHDSDAVRYLRKAALRDPLQRNLRYELSIFSMSLRNAATLWGVADEMLKVLDQLNALCQTPAT